MNFLSHYYFDSTNTNAYQVVGSLLPDLVKNATKNHNIYPEKLDQNLFNNQNHSYILQGWKKHLLVDKFFHSSDFFTHHQHQLKLQLTPILLSSPIKPFFLAHIGLELLLDSLLIAENKIDVEQLYLQLNQVDEFELISFLEIAQLKDNDTFLNFYHFFKNEKYLETYAHTDKISYALKRICMRIWETPMNHNQEIQLTQILNAYKIKLSQDFIFIFETIAAKLIT